MKKFSKVLSIFLAALTALSFSALCAPVAHAPQAVPLSQFLTDAGTLLQADKKFFEKQGEVAAAGEDEPLRLIVRADGAFDPRGAVAQAGPFDGVSVLQYETAADMKLAKAALEKTAGVEWVCADTAVQAMGNPIAEAIPGIAADGSKHFSWGAAYMGVDDYYDAVGTQGSTVTVAVIDTGIDTDHELFGGFYDPRSNPDGRILNGTSLMGNGSFEDDEGHGTHTAGTVVDLTPSNVKILPVKVLDSFGEGSMSGIMLGMLYAVEQGADILSLSLGGMPEQYDVMEYVVDYAFAHGALCVVAAGNERVNADHVSPARLEKCITVSALDKDLQLAYYSNFGDIVDVCAPGSDVYSAKIGGGYIAFSGTSMATPHVAAVAAVYKAQDTSLTPAALEQKLKATATPMGKEQFYGAGLVALRATDTPTCRLEAKVNDDADRPTVTLSCEQPATIYYTTDGTEPTTASQKFTKPFEAQQSCLFRAVGYTANGKTLPVSIPLFVGGTQAKYTLLTEGNTLTGALGYIGEEVTLPAGITEIGAFALDGTPVQILHTTTKLRTIGDCAFEDTAISQIDLSAVDTVGETAFGNTALNSLTLPAARSIGGSAFRGCADLFTLSAPNVRTIGDCAFSGTSLAQIDLAGVETIGAHAFETDGLESCTFEELRLPNVRTIGNSAFAYMSLRTVSCPKLTTLGAYAFAVCILENVELPALTEAGEGAMSNIGAQELSLPKLVTLGIGGLYGAYALQTLSVPSLKYVGDVALYGIGCTEIDLPQAETIGYGACANTMAQTIRAPKAKEIGAYAFSNADLKTLEIPSAEHLGEGFAAGLQKFVVPDSVQTIDADAFWNIQLVLVKNNSPAHRFCEDYDVNYAIIGTIFTVRFYSAGGRLLREMVVEAGESVQAPRAPFKFLKVFSYWEEMSGQCSTDCITCDAEFYPVYTSVLDAIRNAMEETKYALLYILLSFILGF